MVRKSNFQQSEYRPELDLLEAISGKWTVQTVYTLASRTMRYSELQRSINGISQKMLTQTLRNLECNGMIARTVYPVVPPRVEYTLTPLGKSLTQVLDPVYAWAKNHHKEAEEARALYAASKA
jgi:DNA-binding HxlR family transcriptional regulator